MQKADGDNRADDQSQHAECDHGEAALEPAMPLKRAGAVSLTMTADEGVGYVAGPEGIARVDLKAKTTAALTA